MRILLIITLAGIFPRYALAVVPSNFSIQDLLTDQEFQKYLKRPKYKNRIDLFRKIFKLRTHRLRRSIRLTQWGKTVQVLQQFRGLCHHIREESETANQNDLRSKQVKQLEIRLRKLIATLDNLKPTTPFEYHPEFESSIKILRELRQILLKQLFKNLSVAHHTTRECTCCFKKNLVFKGLI